MADIDIAELIAEHLGPRDELGMQDLLLSRSVAGTRTPGNLAGGTNPSATTFTGRGSLERTGKFMDGTLVRDGSVLISILGATLSPLTVPAEGDKITLDGTTYKVSRVLSDQVNAMHECEAK